MEGHTFMLCMFLWVKVEPQRNWWTVYQPKPQNLINLRGGHHRRPISQRLHGTRLSTARQRQTFMMLFWWKVLADFSIMSTSVWLESEPCRRITLYSTVGCIHWWQWGEETVGGRWEIMKRDAGGGADKAEHAKQGINTVGNKVLNQYREQTWRHQIHKMNLLQCKD